MGRKSLDKEINRDSKKRIDLALKSFPLFQEMGVKEFKMDQLATLLNKSKTTIYKYFVGREDLVGFLVEYKLKKLEGYKDYLLNEDLDYLLRYQKSVEYIGEELSGLSNKFLFEVSETYPTIWKEIQRFQMEASKILEKYYLEGIEKDVFKNINPRVLITMDKLFFEAILSKDFLVRGDITVKSALTDYFKLKCYGMLSN